MTTSTRNTLKKWHVSYDPYTDLFQMYDGHVFEMPKNSISEKNIDGFRFLYLKTTSNPVLVEIKGAYNKLGRDIVNLDRSDIIKIVEPLIETYI